MLLEFLQNISILIMVILIAVSLFIEPFFPPSPRISNPYEKEPVEIVGFILCLTLVVLNFGYAQSVKENYCHMTVEYDGMCGMKRNSPCKIKYECNDVIFTLCMLGNLVFPFISGTYVFVYIFSKKSSLFYRLFISK